MDYSRYKCSNSRWTKGTGYLPSTIQNENSEIVKFLNENQLMRVANEQLKNMGKWTSFSRTNVLEAEQALKEVEEKITNLVK